MIPIWEGMELEMEVYRQDGRSSDEKFFEQLQLCGQIVGYNDDTCQKHVYFKTSQDVVRVADRRRKFADKFVREL